MPFECSFKSFSYKSFANILAKVGGGGGGEGVWAPPLNLPLPVSQGFRPPKGFVPPERDP